MQVKLTASSFLSAFLAVLIFVIGLAFLVLVHPVPGLVFMFCSFFYLPATNTFFQMHFGFSIPILVKILFALAFVWFTLGVSDLGNIIDNYLM